MYRPTLKNIFRKKNEALLLVDSLVKELKADVFVEDEKGEILLGVSKSSTPFQQPLEIEGELIGWVKGDEKTLLVAQLLTHLIQKETERKKLGNEVLNLYQEVNLMYNFSDKLAQTIDATDISAVTLDEASRQIRSNNAVVILWQEERKILEVIASMGNSFFDPWKINDELTLLSNIILSGQSEIINDTTALVEAGIILPHIRSIVYSA